jgi:hypothetical protein
MISVNVREETAHPLSHAEFEEGEWGTLPQGSSWTQPDFRTGPMSGPIRTAC